MQKYLILQEVKFKLAHIDKTDIMFKLSNRSDSKY